MRVLFATAEMSPLAKTGGLADVSAALPLALAECGVDIRTILPAYPSALDSVIAKGSAIALGPMLGLDDVALIAAKTPDTQIPLWLLDCPSLYRREGGLYADPEKRAWADNFLRFGLLSHVVARMAVDGAGTDWLPDLVHVNDWHLGLAPFLMAHRNAPRVPTLLTIHNLAFQGNFAADVTSRLGLPAGALSPEGIEFYGQLSFLKAGIRYADRLTTVSPAYAREIQTPEFGCGLDGLLRMRKTHLFGILNGIDQTRWTPEDPFQLPAAYDRRDLSGKRVCKLALQSQMGLTGDLETPLFVFASRLTEQKMADMLPAFAEHLVQLGGQLVICGEGDVAIEDALAALPRRFPGQVAVRIGHDETLTRRCIAGADIIAAPARFEPCGLVQMYAMRYGAIPIVRRVGGLANTVVDWDERGGSNTKATGFMFDEPTVDGLAKAAVRAIGVYRTPLSWRAMQKRAMGQDFAWPRSAQRYLAHYHALARAAEIGTISKGLPIKTASA